MAVPGKFEGGWGPNLFSNPSDYTGPGAAARLTGQPGQYAKDNQKCTRDAKVLT